MKKRTIIILVSIVCAVALCVGVAALANNRANSPAVTGETVTAGPGTESETEASTVLNTEPETEPATEEPETQAPAEPEKLRLNMDLFDDFGKTYSEIAAKRGNLVKVARFEGGICYLFEEGYGVWYCWNPQIAGINEDTYQNLEKDENEYSGL